MKNAVWFMASFAITAALLLSSGCASVPGYAESQRVWRGPAGSIDYHRWAMTGML